MSKVSKVVFATFTQHCIQCTDFMTEVLKVNAACNLAKLYKYNTICPMSKVSKEIKICIIHYIKRCLFFMSEVLNILYRIYIDSKVNMSEVSKVHVTYTVDSNTKYLNYIELQIKCSYYKKI